MAKADSVRPGGEQRCCTYRRSSTLSTVQAEVAQLVERNLAKVEVAGSSPVFRSGEGRLIAPFLATWPSGLGTGLQNPVHRFDSGRRLETVYTQRQRALSSGGERFLDAEEVVGSNPAAPTMRNPLRRKGFRRVWG